MTTTRHLRIHFTVSEISAGTVLADLAGRVDQLDYEVVELVPHSQNKPRGQHAHNGQANGQANGSKVPTGRRWQASMKKSRMPEIFASTLASLKKNGEPLTTQVAKEVLGLNKYAPISYSHALVVLQKHGLIKRTPGVGRYEVL